MDASLLGYATDSCPSIPADPIMLPARTVDDFDDLTGLAAGVHLPRLDDDPVANPSNHSIAPPFSSSAFADIRVRQRPGLDCDPPTWRLCRPGRPVGAAVIAR
jgi:hypothetical protein